MIAASAADASFAFIRVFPGAPSASVGRSGDEVLGADTFGRIRPRMDRAIAGQPQVCGISHPPGGRRIRIALTPDQSGRGAYILSTDVSAEVQAREALSHAAKRQLAAQVTSGERRFRPRPVGLRARLDDLAAVARPTPGGAITLGTFAADLPGRVVLDPGAVQDALLNLVLNGRDAVNGAGRGS